MRSLWRWFTDAALAESIAGDLEEQRRRRAGKSRVMAKLWFWRRTAAITLYFGRAQMQALLARVFHQKFASPGGIGSDLKFSIRALRRAPAYTTTVIGVIALGMTLATTVFAVVDGVLFKPLPYPDADRLVAIETGFNNLPAATRSTPSWIPPRPGNGASVQDIASWQAAAPEAAITGIREVLSGMGEGLNEPTHSVGLVQPNFFETIGVPPIVGGLTASDFDHEGLVRPVVITYELWQSRFHGASDAIGRTFITDPTAGSGFRVAGVMPRGFVFPSAGRAVSFIAPYVPSPSELRDPTRRTIHTIITRLPKDMSMAALRARVEQGMAATGAALPTRPRLPGYSDRGWRMQGPFDHADVVPLASELGSTERPLFRAIFLAALVLVVLGGLNVSGLMAARGLDRARELGLRRALGATGVRLARLVFLEALVPITVATALGLLLAAPLLHLGVRLLPEDLVLLKSQIEPTIDARVVMFVVLSASVLAMLTTIWPIRRALGIGATPLGDGSRGSTRTRSIGRTVIIVSQVAGALVLTMGGALLVTSIMAVYAHTPAIRTNGVVVLRESMQGDAGAMGSAGRAARLVETLRRVPGVEGVALSDGQVLEGGGGTPGWPAPAGITSRLEVVSELVTPDFYRVLEPQLVMGRFPTDAELESDAPVIVVSESVARAYWPNASPLGQNLTYRRGNHQEPFDVVGVVKDIRWNYWDTEVGAVYGPYARLSDQSSPTVFIRTRKSAGQITAQAMQAIAAFDPLIRTTQSGTLDELFADTVRPRRFKAWLFGSFAVAALVIVGAGILGLIAMSTARRTREMGIRLALGSTREALVRLLLREQLVHVAVGIIAGSLISVWAVRFVRGYLYEVTPYDLRVWAVAIMVIVVTTAIGTLIPSLRASRTDPVDALRVE
jgi:putative ABC transport system permease protein